MKKILLSALALLAFAGSGAAQNLPSYVPANGLVGWWPFNGNANDESGNNNHGTVNGATLTTDRFGNAGRAYGFNGIDNWIDVDNNSNLSPLIEVSVSCWFFKPSFNSRYEALIVKEGAYNNNQCNYKFQISWANEMAFASDPRGTTGCNTPNGCVGQMTPGQWHHMVGISSSNKLKIYFDGVYYGDSSVLANGNMVTNNLPLSFGRLPFEDPSQPGSNRRMYLDGKLDDIAIYNRALTQQEITALYQGNNTTANCLDLPSNLQQGLVGYWPFCGNANDESGNGNNGTVNGATLTADRFGNAGSAYGFDGTNDFLQVDNSTSFNLTNGHSISTWIKPNGIQQSVIIEKFNALNGPGDGGPQLVLRSSQLVDFSIFHNNSGNFAYSNIPSSSQTWHHVVATWNGSLIKLYQNGFLTDSIPFSNTLNGCIEPLTIGKRAFQSDFHFGGVIDDIAIWNRALSQEEITQLYNQGICKTSITVTDTLLIHTGITAYNPVAYQNTLKVWPNPGNQDITLDAGNLASMQGWKYKVANTLGQTVVNETAISQQQTLIDLSTWGGNGIYYLHLINPQGHAVEIKKIVLAP